MRHLVQGERLGSIHTPVPRPLPKRDDGRDRWNGEWRRGPIAQRGGCRHWLNPGSQSNPGTQLQMRSSLQEELCHSCHSLATSSITLGCMRRCTSHHVCVDPALGEHEKIPQREQHQDVPRVHHVHTASHVRHPHRRAEKKVRPAGNTLITHLRFGALLVRVLTALPIFSAQCGAALAR